MAWDDEFRSPEFFRRWMEECPRSMTLVERFRDGDLYSYRDFSLNLWVVIGSETVIVAYQRRESPEGIADRVRQWWDHVESGKEPTCDRQNIGHSVYGARKDPSTGKLTTVWFVPGAPLSAGVGQAKAMAVENVSCVSP